MFRICTTLLGRGLPPTPLSPAFNLTFFASLLFSDPPLASCFNRLFDVPSPSSSSDPLCNQKSKRHKFLSSFLTYVDYHAVTGNSVKYFCHLRSTVGCKWCLLAVFSSCACATPVCYLLPGRLSQKHITGKDRFMLFWSLQVLSKSTQSELPYFL